MSKANGTCDYCWRPASAHGHFDHKPIFHDEIVERVAAEVAATSSPMTGVTDFLAAAGVDLGDEAQQEKT